MDMARTSVNLLGNCLATAVVARWEGIDFPATDPEPATGDYFSLKLTSIVTATSTGWPSFVPGLNSHWLTAATAFKSRPVSRD